jgi:hypothetical protein
VILRLLLSDEYVDRMGVMTGLDLLLIWDAFLFSCILNAHEYYQVSTAGYLVHHGRRTVLNHKTSTVGRDHPADLFSTGSVRIS